MSKWVTFYYDVLRGGVLNLVVHKDKETATKYFKSNYRNYFQLSQRIKVELPMSYGYPFRKFVGMSKPKFEKEFGKIEREEIIHERN